MKSQRSIEIVVTNTVGLNLMSSNTIEQIRKSLDKNYQNVSVTIIENENDLEDLIQRSPDLVFSGVKYLAFDTQSKKRSSKNKIWLSSILKKNGINYTGSEACSLKMEINKVKAKIVLNEQKILTADFFTVVPGQFKNDSILPIAFPLFIKPIYEGCGQGIDENSLVRNFNDFEEKVAHLYGEENSEVLVEKYLSGREFTVAITQNSTTQELKAFPIELIPQKNSRGDRILSEKDKQEDRESVIHISDKKIFDKVSQFAKKAFSALGARDYGRIDIRMDGHSKLHFLEANLVPGLGKGYFSRSLQIVGGISYSEMINNLAMSAINRAC